MRHLLLVIVLVAGGCFDPQLPDGAIACGAAGCPPGMACSDGLCRATAADTENVMLAVARDGAPARLLAMCDGEVTTAWELGEAPSARALAWGHYHEGRQTLAIGSTDDVFKVFAVEAGAARAVWVADWLRQSRSVCWADYDGDQDLDLALADAEHSMKIFEQRRDGLETEFKAEDMQEPWAVEWGDLDGDGRIEIAVATGDHAAVYRYRGDDEGGGGGGGGRGDQPSFERIWRSPLVEDTRAVEWADLDRDGDLELVTGALAGPVRVYRNDGAGGMVPIWTSPWSGDVPSIAAGDYDRDGDPDLAIAGRSGPSRVYRNDQGTLVEAWSIDASLATWSVKWFDVDGDGDLDLTLGNHAAPSQVLRNDGGELRPWLTLDVDRVRDLAWARWPVAPGTASACDRVRWQ